MYQTLKMKPSPPPETYSTLLTNRFVWFTNTRSKGADGIMNKTSQQNLNLMNSRAQGAVVSVSFAACGILTAVICCFPSDTNSGQRHACLTGHHIS